MQKKLRALLPKDYAKDYRRYRPSSHQNARHRFFHVKYCTNDRVRKRRGLRSQAKLPHRDEASYRAVGSNGDVSARLTSAFRNYSRCSSPSSDNYISMASLDLLSTQLDLRSNHEHHAAEFTQRIQNLRRETVFGTTSHIREIQCLSVASPAMPANYCENYAISINSDDQMGEGENEVARRHGLLPKADTSSTGGHEAETSSESLSIHSLGRRLMERYSQSTLEHIASILCSSPTNSRRSSLLSLISFSSSKISGKMSTDQISSISEDKAAETLKGPKFRLHRGKVLLTDGEQRIWDDLVDESQLAQSSREIPSYPEISLLTRACCGMTAFPSCWQCGFQKHTVGR
jgi:hypothetical protein